jgi:hypothetical protein
MGHSTKDLDKKNVTSEGPRKSNEIKREAREQRQVECKGPGELPEPHAARSGQCDSQVV